MLKFFRTKAVTKFVLWTLLILILPAFVMWGTASLSRSKEKRPTFAGIIHGKKVSLNELSESLFGTKCQLMLNYWNMPDVVRELERQRSLLAKIAWKRLVMFKESKRYGITVSDKEVAEYLRSHPLFVRSGKFDEKIYGYFLHYNVGTSPRDFEEAIRKNLAIAKLEDALTKDLSTKDIKDEEIMQEFASQYQKTRFSYVLFEARDSGEAPASEKPDEAVPQDKEARTACLEGVRTAREALRALIEEKKESFESACAQLNLKVRQTDFLARGQGIEGLDMAKELLAVASVLGEGKISEPIEVSNGYVIVGSVESQKFDEKTYQEKKEECAQRVLQKKRSVLLDEWYSRISSDVTLAINFEDFDKPRE